MGACWVLGACGPKFSAGDSAGAGAGGSTAGAGNTVNAAGSSGKAGSEGGRGGSLPSAGTDSGGTDGGTGGAIVLTGGSGGVVNVAGAGGSSGSAGTAGAIDLPLIPEQGLALWLRADLGVLQKDGLVQQWQDQSGNVMNGIQATANARPKLIADALGGLPAIEFDGQNDFLSLPDGFGDFGKGLTGFMVAMPTASDCASLVELSNGSEIQDIALGMWQNKWTYEVEVPYMQMGDVDLMSFSMYSVVHRPLAGNPSAELRIGGSALQTLAMALPAVPDDMVRKNNFVGHTLYLNCNYFQGRIAEIILYARAVTPNELKAIEAYLVDRWKLLEQTPAP